MTFAEKVKYVRGVLLISQKELAKELGVSNVTINRWENGVINPALKSRNNVCGVQIVTKLHIQMSVKSAEEKHSKIRQ